MEIDEMLRKSNYDVATTKKLLSSISKKDIINRVNVLKSYKDKLHKLLTIPMIEQKSQEWYEARHKAITASDLAQALGDGKFGTAKDLIVKKVDPPECGKIDNPFFKWGNMFEDVASDIYSRMFNVKVHNFGLLAHPKVDYFAASPDGITEDGIMLEIKCPLKRKIGGDVPKQYYYQIQGQLDVCDLDECDYFECEFKLCNNFEEFKYIANTKGVFYKNHDDSYEYGPVVLKNGNNFDEIINFMSQHDNPSKITLWVLENYNLKRVLRDKEFIDDKLLKLKDIWDKILLYRQDKKLYELEVLNSINISTEPFKINYTVNNDVKLPRYAFID